MQLVAYGAQDIYLTGNPQITFFKVVYRRHTNFSMETIAQTLNGGTTANNNTGTCTISRNGDLVHKIYVTVTPDSAANYTKDPDFSQLVKEVELEIGGQKIDLHTAEWNNVWNELSTDESKAAGLKSMQGAIGKPGTGATSVTTVNIPLNFWFCRNPGLALPLIALQYHEVKIKCKWNSITNYNGDIAAVSPTINCDYIYLDTDERRRFAQVSHEYLIEQLQVESMTGASGEKKINFNHPVKELIWMSDSDYGTAQLKLNGHDRFQKQKKEYFQLRQIYDYHTAIPSQNLPIAARISGGALRGAEDLVPVPGAFDGSSGSFTGHGTGKTGLGNIRISGIGGTVINIGTASSTAPTAGELAEFKVGDTIALIGSSDTSVSSNVGGAVGFVGTGTGAGQPAAIQGVLNDIRLGIEFDGTVETDHALDETFDTAGVTAQTVNQVIAAVGTQGVSSLANVFTGIIAETPAADGDSIKLTLRAGLNNGSNFISSLNAGDPALAAELIAANGDAAFTDASAGLEFTVSPAQFKLRKVDNRVVSEARTSKLKTAINVYSFALKPEEHQPSGTCNFSRIDNAQLKFDNQISATSGESKNLYAVNYNVLRIMSGMGGLAYSN